ncbi:hypothetical protein SETIT_3G342600v2 [Setaria italica]|uniref:Uncharacterized protein n=1 Tax=Setaria italica TaxID=4555 RepID=A0A368QMG2_SETIT|nr:hypothetical protein SETIT_3G342600v2 [Setaria italica]
MAELASGAVSSLLGLLRNEVLLLSRVGSDVEFIKEEMESMHSFLEHLARTAPPAGGHDEQVRTWMKQVRDLAHDCSNCIDLYLRRGDPAVYRARGGRWRYLWWASWLVQKMVTQHNAAIRLRELKERARDVGKRRLRYGVEIPQKEAWGSAVVPSMPSSSQAAATEEEEEDHQNQASVVAADGSDPRQRALEPRLLEEYCTEKLANWLQLQAETNKDVSISSIAIVVPDDTEDAAGAIAREALTLASANFTCKVWINLSALHLPWDLPLLGSEILSYILRECEQQQGTVGEQDPREQAYRYKDELQDTIWNMIDDDDIVERIEEIKSKIGEVDEGKIGFDRNKKLEESKTLGILILLRVLQLMQSAPDRSMPLSSEDAMKETASRLKSHMEAGKPQICLDNNQYMDILRKVFPASKPLQPQTQEASHGATTLGEDHIKEITNNHKITLDIIWELLCKQQLLESTSAKKEHATGCNKLHGGHDQVGNSAAVASTEQSKEKVEETSGEVQVSSAAAAAAVKEAKEKMKEFRGEVKARNAIAATINETKEKMDKISEEITDKLFIKGIVDKIKPHLENNKTLIILQDDEDYISTEDDEDDVSTWEETRNALNLLGCAPGSAVIVSTKSSQKAKEFCYPQREPITYSLIGLYHDIVLQLTQQREYDPQVLLKILYMCDPHEFCMKIFAHALYANPKRSYDELTKLYQDLGAQKTLGSEAKRMIKFSYRDLPREYKTCFLYLAIFPQGHNISRSTLIGRWVAEGLITKEDWSTAVFHAEQCFEALIKRGLVLPCDIGVAGKVKSCMVGHQVHGFITKIAKKEHILDARLSDVVARHFSIFCGLRLRASDGIGTFVSKLPKYLPQLPLLKVLDLEGWVNSEKLNHYLKDICRKILFLKYLSLRGTKVTDLPNEINNLHELEVLDIRQTEVPARKTKGLLLLKLRRLLADCNDPKMNGDPLHSPVQIPRKIRRMENLEVLSNVKASSDGSELKDIKYLWQLRKLGVVIQDEHRHLDNLLSSINDLKECLQSLSITISNTRRKRKNITLRKSPQPKDMGTLSTLSPRRLESISINGFIPGEKLLEVLAKDCDELAKVTLSSTRLEQGDLMVLALLDKLRCVRLRSYAYSGRKLIFNKDEFPHLKYFLVEGHNMTNIEFQYNTSAELEKIVLSFTNIRSLCGIGNLPQLKELELEENRSLLSFSQDEAALEEKTESRAPEQNTEVIAANKTIQSGSLGQNTEIKAPEHNIQSRSPEENTQNRAAEQSTEGGFTFDKEKFQQLKYFCVKESKTTNITFKEGAAPELKKITLSLRDENSKITGVEYLPKLKEIELKGGKFLLQLFDNAVKVAKVTLSDTNLKQEDMKILGMKTNLRCLVLSDKSYDEKHLAFNEDAKFPVLDLLIVECPNINSISFTAGSAQKLEKIVCSFTNMNSLSGIDKLPKLNEIEYSGGRVPYLVRKEIAALKRQPVLTYNNPQQQNQARTMKAKQKREMLQKDLQLS